MTTFKDIYCFKCNCKTSMFHNLYFVWVWVLITVDGWTSTLLTIETNACTVLVKGTCQTWAVS